MRLRGLPWLTKREDVLQFFVDVNILDVYLCTDTYGSKIGAAYLQVKYGFKAPFSLQSASFCLQLCVFSSCASL